MTSALVERLCHHARVRPDQTAVVEVAVDGRERTFGWRTLRDAAWATAVQLRGAGVVMVVASNCFELLARILGGLWAGASVLPVSAATPASEIGSLAIRARARTLISDPTRRRELQRLPLAWLPLADLPDPGPEPAPSETGAAARGSLLLKSSGTTGPPKIVRRRAPALDAVGRNCARALAAGEADRMLLAIPLCHSYGIDQGVLTAVFAGCTIELHERFERGWVARSLAERGVSLLPAVPWILDALSRTPRSTLAAPTLRCAFSAGSPVPDRVHERFASTFGRQVGQIYGATEFGSVSFNDPDAPGFRPDSAGLPFDGVEIRILDPQLPRLDRPLPPGREGQVAVSSPSMLSEYLEDDEAPLEAGFLLTGDLGRLDREGRLDLCGRLKFLIDVGGFKVNPLEVEAVLQRHPAVREAVALALPHTETASRVKAIIIPEPGTQLDGRTLERFAREHLIHYMVPRSFEFRRDVPRSPAGKILREALQAELAGGGGS